MNWQEIKEKYPRALELIYEYADKYAIGAFVDDFKYQRLLYDFFDGQGIIISVYGSLDFIDIGRNAFGWQISLSSEDFESAGKDYNTRTEAEGQAFLKAFSILEEKL